MTTTTERSGATGAPRRLSWALLVGAAGLVAFHLTWIVATAMEEGYRWQREFISALAAPTAERPVLMTIGFVALTVGILATALVVARHPGSGVAVGFLLVAAAGSLVTTVSRQACSTNLPECAAVLRDDPLGSATRIHDLGATVFFVSLMAAGLALGWPSSRQPIARLVAWVVAGGLVAVLTAWLLGSGANDGALERALVVLLSCWVVVLAAARAGRQPSPGAATGSRGSTAASSALIDGP